MFRWLILSGIRLYWLLVRPRRRRKCLFRESCSHHVYRVTEERGSCAGLKALRRRIRRCRPGFSVEWTGGAWNVRWVDGHVSREQDVAGHVVEPYRRALKDAESIIMTRLVNPEQGVVSAPSAGSGTTRPR